jgi:hypothetical protein
MELLSDRFKQEVKKAFSNPSISILATIPARPLSFTESLRYSPNTTVFMVSSYGGITAVLTFNIHSSWCLDILTRNKKTTIITNMYILMRGIFGIITQVDGWGAVYGSFIFVNCFLVKYYNTRTVYVKHAQSLNVHVCVCIYIYLQIHFLHSRLYSFIS